MTEQKIQTSIADYLRKRGWTVVKIMAASLNGWPDLHAVKEGRAIYIEVKRPGGRLSKIQEYRIEQLKKQEMRVHVVDSLDAIKRKGY